ncbi:unnamed protein product [Euphydryas editha]|uniref:CRAL-TRIO domain-containing protein n=1 Tax=Euphydryas editha TaxID=104508 RepID=A0AAU9U7P5_EUPED|nr:unnamed protein product [Euphydryas editha]
MDFIPKNPILEFKPDTLECIRKQYDLDKPGQMKEAVNILRDWVQKQNHFKKKDFGDHYYEIIIITSKGSLERAKARIDKICTMRTLLPQFFAGSNVKTDFGNIHDFSYTFMLPKLTSDHYRVELIKFENYPISQSQFKNYLKSQIVMADYLQSNDYMNGFIIVVDLTETNLSEFLSLLNPIELRQIISIFVEGYGMRIKGIHLISPSKLIDALIAIARQVLSSKIAGRIHIHKTIEEIYKFIPKHILPKDYGGEERSLNELQATWIEVLSSEKHLKYMREINKACTDENYRRSDKFNEQCAGMPGTFRLLSVD